MTLQNDQLSNDDENWLAALAGNRVKADLSHDPTTLAEADRLRQALIRQENIINSQLGPYLHQGLNHLLERLRQESLLPEAPPQKKDARPWWMVAWALAGSLTVMVIFGTVAPLVFDRDQLTITASADQTTLVIQVVSPWHHAQQVAAVIRQAGGKAHIRKQPNGHVMLYGEASPEVITMLRQHNMNPPMDHGMFVIAFVPMQKTPNPPST